jgi:hypothetical protein
VPHQFAEQDRPDPEPLPRVLDQNAELGCAVARGATARERHHVIRTGVRDEGDVVRVAGQRLAQVAGGERRHVPVKPAVSGHRRAPVHHPR